MADTTKVTIGRRKLPRCQGMWCQRRVDAKGDEFCRVCLQVKSLATSRTTSTTTKGTR